MKFKKLFKLFSIYAILILLFQNNIYASVKDAEDKVNSIKNQIEQNKDKINDVESEVSDKLDEIDNINNQISGYQAKLDDLNKQIANVNSKISEYQNDLQRTSQKYNSIQDVYAIRLRAIYENGIPSVFDVLLSSKGISDFFSKLNVISSMLDYDKNLTTNMQSQKEYVNYIKKDIENQKIELNQLQYDAQKSNESLKDAKSNQQQKVTELNNSKIELLAANKILIQQQEIAENEVQKEIEKYNNSQNKSPTSIATYKGKFGGMFIWPVSSSKINAGFGYYDPYNTGTYIKHTGVDIGGVGYNSEVHAAADGQIVTAKHITDDPDGPSTGKKSAGYGNYIMIYHGKNDNGISYYTIYGHLSALKVSAGETVKQGQIIGITGSTGNSTGAHLHFEIRENGTAVNPLKYFDKQ